MKVRLFGSNYKVKESCELGWLSICAVGMIVGMVGIYFVGFAFL